MALLHKAYEEKISELMFGFHSWFAFVEQNTNIIIMININRNIMININNNIAS